VRRCDASARVGTAQAARGAVGRGAGPPPPSDGSPTRYPAPPISPRAATFEQRQCRDVGFPDDRRDGSGSRCLRRRVRGERGAGSRMMPSARWSRCRLRPSHPAGHERGQQTPAAGDRQPYPGPRPAPLKTRSRAEFVSRRPSAAGATQTHPSRRRLEPPSRRRLERSPRLRLARGQGGRPRRRYQTARARCDPRAGSSRG
jgi:hypothetical protein